MDSFRMDITQIQQTAVLIKNCVNANGQSFYDILKNQQNISNWQGVAGQIFSQQFAQLNQEFERQNQVFTSYHIILKNYLCQSHIDTEAANLMLSNQIK